MHSLRRARTVTAIAATALCGIGWMLSAPLSRAGEDLLWRYRNLGKAFYENPTTQQQAVEEFRKALGLAPGSARETVNYGIALLRAGRVAEGIAQLQKAQKLDPRIPHTWFNLGMAFKKQAEFDRALAQFQQMARLAPNEPATHYQLGALHKLGNDPAAAAGEFERARDLNPRLAAPHFQLYGIYRQANRPEDAARELEKFQELKKQQEGAAVPEDMEWSVYSEIYDAPPFPAARPPAAAVYGERTRIVTVSDCDEEVRAAVRAVVDAVRAGTPLDRIAILHASPEPYARLAHEQLAAAGITLNGAAVMPLTARLVGRTLLGLFALPDSGFRREDVFAWLAGGRLHYEGRRLPVTSWERLSREAGVVAGRSDWHRRLTTFADGREAEAELADKDPDAPAWRAESFRTEAQRAGALRDFVVGVIGRPRTAPD